ncbi:hypothetical protein EG832_11525, partial [bacterium]|nr:hypothetical protein [bacterium]
MAIDIKIRTGNDADKPSNVNAAILLLAGDTHRLYHGNASGVPYQVLAVPDVNNLAASTDAADGANDYLPIYDNSNTGHRKIKFDDLAKSTRSFYIPAGSNLASVTNGAAWVGNLEMATNKQTLGVFDFDPTTDKGIEFGYCMPGDYDGGTVKYQVVWTCTGG